MPRGDTAPADERDYEDRNRIRATSDEARMRRYIRYDWHRVAQQLVMRLAPTLVSIVLAPALLTLLSVVLTVALLMFFPELRPRDAVLIVNGPLGGGSGLVALARYVRRRSRKDSGG